MKGVPNNYIVSLALMALACSVASAYDAAPLQDFCVAVNTSTEAVFVNGKPNTWPQHTRHILSSFRLCTVRLKSTPHSPSWNRDSSSRRRYFARCFVTSNPDNHLFTKTLNAGDVFVFPIGLIYFQFNVGKTNAVVFAGLNSQNPRLIIIANVVFGSNSLINPDVLTKAFQVDKNVIDYLEKQFK
ncbi:hypothetical protein SLA2020_271520 [Shorea laevis]